MELQRIEARVIELVDAALAGQNVEDDTVELKAGWPDATHKTARQIAGHANTCGGSPILWVIGVDERARQLCEAAGVEAANWWGQVSRWFDEETPRMRSIGVTVRPGKRVYVLQFETDRAPYVVGTPKGGQVEREVPWREGNSTRTARRHELIRSVLAQIEVPHLESIEAKLSLSQRIRESPGDGSVGRKVAVGGHLIAAALRIYVSAPSPATLPEHKQSLTLRGTSLDVDLGAFDATGPYRLGGQSQSGGRRHEPAGAISVLGRSGLAVEGSGEVTLRVNTPVADEDALAISRARRLDLLLRLPVDLSDREARLLVTLRHTPGSAEPREGLPSHKTWRTVTSFHATR